MNNISEIAKNIFTKEPQQTGSIQLELEKSDLNNLFEILTLILLEGITIKYGEDTDLTYLNDLNTRQINDNFFLKFKEYFNSFGFDINMEIKTEIPQLNSSKKLLYDNKNYNFNMCTLYKTQTVEDKVYFSYYHPFLKIEILNNTSLNIITKKYLLSISFDFHY